MKITITASLGHISKPLTEKLVQQGHDLTLISSNPEKEAGHSDNSIPHVTSIAISPYLTAAPFILIKNNIYVR